MFGYFPYLFVEALDVVFVALAFVFRKLFLNNLAEGVVFLDFVLGDFRFGFRGGCFSFRLFAGSCRLLTGVSSLGAGLFRFSVIFSSRLLCGFCRCGGGIIEFYMGQSLGSLSLIRVLDDGQGFCAFGLLNDMRLSVVAPMVFGGRRLLGVVLHRCSVVSH